MPGSVRAEKDDPSEVAGFGPLGPPLINASDPDLARAIQTSPIQKVTFVAWRDLDDPEAGGSERHAHEIATRWAAAGLDVTVRTSAVHARGAVIERNNYRAERRSGRYAIFPHVMREGWRLRPTPTDALVEIWNGMPFFSPLWHRGPRLTFIHHVHDVMWDLTLPPRLARAGRTIESHVAPYFYRNETIVTLSPSSRSEIVERMRLTPERIRVVPPGIDPRYRLGSSRSSTPVVVAVGRLVPVKRVDSLIDALVVAKHRVPSLRAEIIGEGRERPDLEAKVHRLDAEGWIEFTGYASDDYVVGAYQRAWLLASASIREGWGMTISEAAACGTPAVVSNIVGHRDVVRDGRTGVLVDRPEQMGDAIASLLLDPTRRSAMGMAARERSEELTWNRTALLTFNALSQSATSMRSFGARRSMSASPTAASTSVPAGA